MNEDKNIALLKTVKKVTPSPFLYSKIEARINAQTPEKIREQWIWASSAAFAVLLLFNVFFISNNFDIGSAADIQIENIADEMGLQQSNQLYYD